MQQWEYCTATLTHVALSWTKGWQLMQMNDQEIPNWRDTAAYPSLVAFCNQMGSQGWELICELRPDNIDMTLCFKRSRE